MHGARHVHHPLAADGEAAVPQHPRHTATYSWHAAVRWTAGLMD